MGSFAWDLPLEFGGAPSSGEKIYRALRGALGAGGVAPSEDGIDGLILYAEAQALAACAAFDERAALQAFPSFAIDNLPAYEDVLGLVPAPDEDETTRRANASIEWASARSAEIPTLSVLLKQIDSRLSVLDDTWANSKVSVVGMPFYPFVIETWMNPPSTSGLAAYSSRSEFYVLLDLGAPGTIPGLPELAIIEQVKRFLKKVLPAEVIPFVVTEVGLIAGVSPVGYAGITGA